MWTDMPQCRRIATTKVRKGLLSGCHRSKPRLFEVGPGVFMPDVFQLDRKTRRVAIEPNI